MNHQIHTHMNIHMLEKKKSGETTYVFGKYSPQSCTVN